jgi:acyl transferase domain-containing protein
MVSVACEELGVNLMLLPALGTSFAVAGMTSSNGRCQTRMDV